MATQRRVPSKDESENEAAPAIHSDVAPAVPADVIYKLLGFTFAMIVVPIGSYFATVNTVFNGKATYAGGLAAFMANVVVVAYVIVAMKEDQSDRLEAEKEAKKSR